MNGSETTTTLEDEGVLPSSRLLSSSISSLSSNRHGSSHLSEVYRQASSLFLTRRFAEALATIEPVITAASPSDNSDGDVEAAEAAPVASASRKQRIKIWNLYLTILNAVIELGPEEGKNTFGGKEWKAIVSKVGDGIIWEDIVRNGYGGVEGNVDSEVVINLATLLLAHSSSQAVTQQRLETYLSASQQPNLDIPSDLLSSDTYEAVPRRRKPNGSGTDTPRDLNSRLRILELYTLHVLPRNEEWDYAKEFITLSEVLDEDKRELFLQALQGLREEKVRDGEREARLQKEREEELARQRAVTDRKMAEAAKEKQARSNDQMDGRSHKRSSSEVDYGIDTSNPNGVAKVSPSKTSSAKQAKTAPSARGSVSATPQSPRTNKRSTASSRSISTRAARVVATWNQLFRRIGETMSHNPMVLLRMVLFLMGLILAFTRRDVRDRIRRITGSGWDKVKATVGMGVKVSYI